MNKSGQTGHMPSCGRLLLGAVGCSALALGIGFFLGNIWIYVVPLGAMLLVVPAGIFGFLARRMLLGALAAPLIGFVGGVGLAWRISPNTWWIVPHEEHWLLSVAILGSLGGLFCLVGGSLGGLIGDQRSKAAADTSPPLPPLPPDPEAEA